MPHPLLETDSCECMHKGKVTLESSTKDFLSVNDAGMITINDLLNASIVGCTNTLAGVPAPCTKLINVPSSIVSSLLQVNKQKIVLSEYINQVSTDKGSPLNLTGESKAKGIFEISQ